MAITPHGTSVPMGLILASAGKAVAQNAGLCGGHPGNTGLDVIARNSRIKEILAAGQMPRSNRSRRASSRARRSSAGSRSVLRSADATAFSAPDRPA